MKKLIFAIATSAVLAATSVAASAQARGGFGPGIVGGLVAGAVIDGLASNAYGYSSEYGYGYGPGYGYYDGGDAPAHYGGLFCGVGWVGWGIALTSGFDPHLFEGKIRTLGIRESFQPGFPRLIANLNAAVFANQSRLNIVQGLAGRRVAHRIPAPAAAHNKPRAAARDPPAHHGSSIPPIRPPASPAAFRLCWSDGRIGSMAKAMPSNTPIILFILVPSARGSQCCQAS